MIPRHLFIAISVLLLTVLGGSGHGRRYGTAVQRNRGTCGRASPQAPRVEAHAEHG